MKRTLEWRIDFIEVCFQGKIKLYEKTIKKNLQKEDLEMIGVLLRSKKDGNN